MSSYGRSTYRGSKLFINDVPAHRVSSFGSTSNLTKEEIRELGNSKILGFIEDIPQVECTLETNDSASIVTLAALAGYKRDGTQIIDLSKDFEFGRSDIYCTISPSSSNDILRTQYIENAFLTGLSLNYSVDGNITENFNLAADNKAWYLNDAARITARNSDAAIGNTVTVSTGGDKVYKVLGVYRDLNNRWEKIDPRLFTVDLSSTGSIEITFNSGVIQDGEKVYVRYANDRSYLMWDEWPVGPNSPGALRRGHVEIYLVKNVQANGGKIISGIEEKQFRVQSVSLDATLNREDLSELGSHRFYDRPLEFPINIDGSIEISDYDLKLFAKFCGVDDLDSVQELSIDKLNADIGLRVKIYTQTDVDNPNRKPVKVVDVPKLVVTDEGWNISLDASGSQTFSFRAYDMAFMVGTEINTLIS